MLHKIKVIQVDQGILSHIDDEFDVSICNPPFFDNGTDHSDGYGGKEQELCTEGGEVKFIKQYMVESWTKRKAVKWFSCLVGIKSHLQQLEQFLSNNFEKANVTKTTLFQGNTLRWVIAWNFRIQDADL